MYEVTEITPDNFDSIGMHRKSGWAVTRNGKVVVEGLLSFASKKIWFTNREEAEKTVSIWNTPLSEIKVGDKVIIHYHNDLHTPVPVVAASANTITVQLPNDKKIQIGRETGEQTRKPKSGIAWRFTRKDS